MNQASIKISTNGSASVAALIGLFLNILSLAGSFVVMALSISSITNIGHENWGYFGVVCFGLPISVVQLIIFLISTKISRAKDGQGATTMNKAAKIVRVLPLIVTIPSLIIAFIFTATF